MKKELNKYESKIPSRLLPHSKMYASYLMDLCKKEYESCKIIRCGKLAIGYVYMYYEDYDTIYNSEHSVQLSFFIDENYLFESVINLIINESINFYNIKKEENNIDCIKVYLDEDNIIPSRYNLYQRWLMLHSFVKEHDNCFVKKM